MTCFHPLEAWQLESGQIVFAERGNVRRALKLPCGRCIGCRLDKSREWAIRCVHEAQLHDANAFVTLTYNDDTLPEEGKLQYRDFQLFMKRLRKEIGPVRFYMCGEYGPSLLRPHFHACLFGAEFPDKKLWKTMSGGSHLYRSEQLEKIWWQGFATIGDVTFESASYVARYVMKKITGTQKKAAYTRLDPTTGELIELPEEFTRMSLKPGIGARWIEQYENDVYTSDCVIIRGKKCRPPKYYDNKLKDKRAERKEEIDYQRFLANAERAHDNTPERLAVREQVTQAQINLKQRTLENDP